MWQAVQTPTREGLAVMTVVQIKEIAKQYQIQAPSKLKKAELIQYILGKLQERNTGTVRGENLPVRYDELVPVYMDLSEYQKYASEEQPAWLIHLHLHGYATVPIAGLDVAWAQSKFFDFLELCSANFKRQDPTTWTRHNLPPLLHGILKHYCGHTELQWVVRELCTPIFAKIWKVAERDLLSSFDGISFRPPDLKQAVWKSWLHNDQHRNEHGFCCVQGVATLMECGAQDGGLVVLEGSHHVFEEYMARHPCDNLNFTKADLNDPALQGRRRLKICAPAGSILLWRSDMMHESSCPQGQIPRMGLYMCQQPRRGADQITLNKRIEAYQKGRVSSHSCYGPWFSINPEHPRTWGSEVNTPTVIEIAMVQPGSLRARLIGYD
jgi:hypothetical protein